MVSRIIPVETFDLVIFGGTGDLARRKILPALFKRFCSGQMPAASQVIGAARRELSTEEYRASVAQALREFASGAAEDDAAVEAFCAHVHYVAVDARGEGGWSELAQLLKADAVRAFYFSVGPGVYSDLAKGLKRHGLTQSDTRIVVEKPFGHDLETAKALNKELAQYFDESQIYRIDHYLGKETVQNLMAVRFGNMLFEPLWNAQYIDHIQITVAENVGVAGRGGYYEKSGAMRDMVQNHLMQLLCLIAMEPPSHFEPDAVRDEKLKVIRALDTVAPHHIVRGQYTAADGVASYREDVENERSKTESFVALKCQVNNWRWAGTPFYLRTGKRLSARDSEITVVFKDTPHSIFGDDAGRHRNELNIQLQPNEGITLNVTIKEPGPGGMRLVDVPLDMSFAEALGPKSEGTADAYERLIMDVIRGNQTLFMRDDEVEAAWAWTDPIIRGWEARGDVPKPYDAFSHGPDDAVRNDAPGRARLERIGQMNFNTYPDADLMAMDVAKVLADDLTEALHNKDRVVLAVPGGTTPGPIFDALSAVDLDWERVDVILTDERWVPEDHERSNSALVKARLLTNRAMAARYLPLYAPADAPEEVLAELETTILGALPVDVALLGMGADMHTASLFPESDGLAAALASDANVLVPIRREDLPDVRITLSARVLDAAVRKHILIKGADKREALQAAQKLPKEQAPIRAISSGAEVHWTE